MAEYGVMRNGGTFGSQTLMNQRYGRVSIVMSVQEVFSNNIRYRIGTVDQFLFYLDTWIGNYSLACQFPMSYNSHHAKVILLHGQDWWPSVFGAMFRRNLLELEESRRPFSYHLLVNFFHGGRCDRNVWMGSSDGSFLLASFFFRLLWEVPHSPVPLTLQFA
eukprot:TRINITY_DN14845_c0_g1_i1.p1 TRINITY_DN14845_c0_g1~~TRINITY_DN14845_c0_g1_i1.p1  ORF type:complete len:162 (-),score=20.30 TRINITY_DN14845_c0_g1_i1:1293-1778(-)